MECAYIYSSLDHTARKINIGKFVHRRAMVLIVTDVAARGIDIPLLDNVINYNFPSKAKLFLHRVGQWLRRRKTSVHFESDQDVIARVCFPPRQAVWDVPVAAAPPTA